MERGREPAVDVESQTVGSSNRLLHSADTSGGGGTSGSGESVVWPTVDGALGLSEERSLEYARSFFLRGFCLLPFLWAVNCFYFWPVLRNRSCTSFDLIRPCKSPFIMHHSLIVI
ncbi:putative gamma-secretase subunit PEN-2 [Platanthera zijinensis]|uniref:Gamma-secretase subunit PEN-2 n=1 Tax=Platanthera zijinensis TaxID=2320716 RepID=A0AAP0GB45_9ASPA